MDRTYHGCAYAKVDGTCEIIGNGECCLVPTSRCFGKDHSEVDCCVKTRSMLKKRRSIQRVIFNRYFEKRLCNGFSLLNND